MRSNNGRRYHHAFTRDFGAAWLHGFAMKLNEFIRQLQAIEAEIGSHPKVDQSLVFWLDGSNDEFAVKSVNPLVNGGCGCCYGAYIELEQT